MGWFHICRKKEHKIELTDPQRIVLNFIRGLSSKQISLATFKKRYEEDWGGLMRANGVGLFWALEDLVKLGYLELIPCEIEEYSVYKLKE